MTNATEQQDADIRVLKEATCRSLSGKSQLKYQIGATPEGEIQLRLHANSAAGAFDRGWVPYARVRQALASAPAGKALTSHALSNIFKGKSANSPSFLFAVLKSEGLVRASTTDRRGYELADPVPFQAAMNELVAAPEKPKDAAKQKGTQQEKPKAKPEDVAPENTKAAAKAKAVGTQKPSSAPKKKSASKPTKK